MFARCSLRLVTLGLLLAPSFAACSRPDSGSAVSSAPAALKQPAPVRPWPAPQAGAKPGLRFLGRVAQSGDTQAQYAWSGSGIRARFLGSGLSVTLNDAQNIHELRVDGQLMPPVVTDRRQSHYVLAKGLPVAEHSVELVRRTEALFGVTHLLGVVVDDGHLLPPPGPKPRRIEVVGDSISAGYGNLGTDTSCPFSAATEDYTRAYSAGLGEILDADVSTVAWSGRGVVKNYAGEPGALVPELYPRTLPEVQISRWDFPYESQAIVVNLGTNDFSTEPDPAQDVFVAAYVSLLEQLRVHNPQAFILCTLGPMLPAADLARAAEAITQAVATRVRTGDQGVVYHALQTPNDAPGCDWHPSVATHMKMAIELAAEISRHVQW